MQELAILGAVNMLDRCGLARAGEHLLVAFEPPELGHYAPGTVDCVVEAGRSLGMSTEVLDVGFAPENPAFSPDLSKAIKAADVVVFLARLGDQLRFSDMPPGKRIIVSYAISAEMFASGFGQVDHCAMLKLRDAANAAMASASEVRLTCPAGTDVIGRPMMDLSPSGDTSILRFPMSVPTPVPAASFSGRVAMPGFLTGTGSNYYAPYTIEFDGPVHALMQDGRLTGFMGGADDVARAEGHYDHVAGLLGIDRGFVHSWHAGLHPGCAYHPPARENYERWSGAAFGNPRLLHFHTCGAYAPGEISWNIIDPTIALDGVAVWENGTLHPERVAGGQELFEEFPELAAAFGAPARDIGFLGALI